MRILAACSLGGAGHLNPLVPFLAAAKRRGDEPLVVGPPALTEMVEEIGYRFFPGGEPPEEVVAPIRERLPVAPPAEASILGNRELFGRLATRSMLEEMERTFVDWRPDFVLREPCEYSSAVVASQRGVPIAQVAISLAEAEAASITAAAPVLAEYRQGLVEELWASPYLSRFPKSLDPSPFPRTKRFREPPTGPHGELPDWWDGSDGPLVYVTFGTVLGYMSTAAHVYRTALKAVEGLEAKVLLTVGRRFDLLELGPIPSNVHVERWVEQAQVLGHADLVVCHGGPGTALGALAAGVPLVVVPLFADQFENGRRISASGAGWIVEIETRGSRESRQQLGKDHVPHIRHAIDVVLAETSYREQARGLAEEMATMPTADLVLANLLAGGT